MVTIIEHHPVDVIRLLLPIIPSTLSILCIFLKKHTELQGQRGYREMALIFLGFMLYPANKYVDIVLGGFVCCLIFLNYARVRKGNLSDGLIFPSLFFFNIVSFTGVNKFENICMVVYASVGVLYIAGLADKKSDTEFRARHEKLCIITSSVIFVVIKFVFLLFTDTLTNQ